MIHRHRLPKTRRRDPPPHRGQNRLEQQQQECESKPERIERPHPRHDCRPVNSLPDEGQQDHGEQNPCHPFARHGPPPGSEE